MKVASNKITVYPNGQFVPANLLRLHVDFGQAIYSNSPLNLIWLEDLDGNKVDHTWVDLTHGLWTADNCVLTILLHPGRVKRGLRSRLLMGPIFVPGESYRFVLDHRLVEDDVCGEAKTTIYEFTAIEPIESKIDPTSWIITTPELGSMLPLRIETGRALDWLSVGESIRLIDTTGRNIGSEIELNGNEIRLFPLVPWPPERGYSLRISDTLEDVCGNRICSPFDERLYKVAA